MNPPPPKHGPKDWEIDQLLARLNGSGELMGEETTPNQDAYWQSAVALGLLPKPTPENWQPAELIARLSDRSAGVRAAATTYLGFLGDPIAVEPLVQVLFQDPDPFTRKEAALALGRLGNQRAVDPLIEVVQSGPSDLRSNAAWALGHIRDTKGVDPLLQILQEPDIDDGLRHFAIMALGDIGDLRALPLLRRLVREGTAGDRASTVLALKGFPQQQVLDILSEVAASDPDPDVRSYAITTLGALGSEQAIPVLEQIMQQDRGKDGQGNPLNERAELAIEHILFWTDPPHQTPYSNDK